MVNLLYVALFKLAVQFTVSVGGAGQDDDPAGFPVQTVDDPQFSEFCRQELRDVRGLAIIAIRDRKQPGGLMNADQELILIQNGGQKVIGKCWHEEGSLAHKWD